ncbi:MAG: hypothetical protein IJ229_12685 [Clostridia bacterium]|nr:hypothetical protein [Clostridia bacterium]MBR1685486.1 hypothetical protein [Clostridia bacterium]
MKQRTICLLLALTLTLCTAMTTVCALAESTYSAPTYPWSFIKKIPMKPKYTEASEHCGSVEKITYTTHSYALEAVASGDVLKAPDDNDTTPDIDAEKLCGGETVFPMEKELYVYLPYGYDPSEKYDVVYALHGTDAGADYWIGDNAMGNTTRKLLDRMIEKGECRPFIMVTPTYYSIPADKADLFPDFWDGDALANVWPMYFWQEMSSDIIPLINSTYATYAGEADARDHMAFVGLSRGSMTTVNSIMLHCLDQFAYFGTFSGIWCDFDVFRETLEGEEYSELPIRFWYNGNGSADFALENHETFRDRVLTEMPERFTDGENYAWVAFKGASHAYNAWLPHLYNSLLVFFTK